MRSTFSEEAIAKFNECIIYKLKTPFQLDTGVNLPGLGCMCAFKEMIFIFLLLIK